MNFYTVSEGLSFNLTLSSPFNFTCHRCCACCYNRHIELNNYEIFRLTEYLRLSRQEFLNQFADLGPRPSLKNKGSGACIFLGSSGCSIHPVRPLVCRLFPLGLLFGPSGEERWGIMPLHPDCFGLISFEGTLADYLQSQGANPYLRFERLAFWRHP
jgi:Fe-S-cluster containining protein